VRSESKLTNGLKSFLIIVVSSLLSSCSYQFGHGELSSRYSTISIPYVEQDQRGELTAELVRQISASGAFRYVNSGGDLTLQVKMADWGEENIDFRYDRKRSGKLKKSLIPTQTRVNALVEVVLIETATQRVIRGPTRITASAEFDHTYYSTRDEINVFSLGQLNDIDAARDAVLQPLNRNLAERIVDYVINSW
jgi:hypothetical protein